MVKEELVDKVLAVEWRSDRVIVLVMSFGKVLVKVISAYAPQQNRKEEEKEKSNSIHARSGRGQSRPPFVSAVFARIYRP